MLSKLFWLMVLAGLGAGGYYLWEKIPTTPKSETFTGYTEGLHSDEQKALAAAAGANVLTAQQAVNKYKIDKGALPTSLQDLVPDYMDHIPGGLQYDASTGTVSAVQ